MDNFIPAHLSTKEAMYLTLKERGRMIDDLQNQILLLNKRLEYLESTFLPIPDKHDILYEKVYQVNPLYPPCQDKVTLDNASPASKTDGVIS